MSSCLIFLHGGGVQPPSWQKESEEIVVRRIVRRLDRFVSEQERLQAESVPPSSGSSAEFQHDSDRTATNILAVIHPEGREVLSVPVDAPPPPPPPPPPPMPMPEAAAEGVSPQHSAPVVPIEPKKAPIPDRVEAPSVKKPSVKTSTPSAPESPNSAPKGQVQMIKMPPPPPPQKRRGRKDEPAGEFAAADSSATDSRVDHLFVDRRDAVAASDRLASKAFLYALALLLIFLAIFALLPYF